LFPRFSQRRFCCSARIGDRVGDFGDAPVEPRAPFGRVEAAAFGLALPQHFVERARRGDHLAHRLASPGAREIVRVLPIGQDRELE